VLVVTVSTRKYTYHEFEALANKTFFSRFHCSEGLSSSCVEKLFWHEMMHGEKGTVEYGVNVEGSAFSCDPDDRLGTSKWNLKVVFLICMLTPFLCSVLLTSASCNRLLIVIASQKLESADVNILVVDCSNIFLPCIFLL